MQLKTKNATFAPKATRIKICVIIQISPNPFWDLEIFLFARERKLERPLRKHAGGMFLGRGRVPQIPDASGTDVDGI